MASPRARAKKVNYVDRFARCRCARQSRVIVVLVKLKKRNRSFVRVMRYTYGNEKSLYKKEKKKRKYYIDVMLIYLKIYNVSIREKTYNKINMWREKIIKNFA